MTIPIGFCDFDPDIEMGTSTGKIVGHFGLVREEGDMRTADLRAFE
jgi:hypothetical protein